MTEMKRGEVEAMIDLLLAIQKKGQWQEKLKREDSPHEEYFTTGIMKLVNVLSEALAIQLKTIPIDMAHREHGGPYERS